MKPPLHRPAPPATRTRRRDPPRWPIRKTMQPGERGAVKLARRHGDALVCVRYRSSADGRERLTTVELIVERARILRRDDPIVSFKLHAWETELRTRARQQGASYDPTTRMWRLRRRDVIRLGLRERIAIEDEHP